MTVFAPHGQIVATLVSLRHNMIEELISEIFRITQLAMSKIKDKIKQLLDEMTGLSERPLDEQTVNCQTVVDAPCAFTRDRRRTGKSNCSGKRTCQCLNVQIASDLD